MTGRELLKLPFLTPEEKALFENNRIVKNPELLEDPVWGTLSSLIYWAEKDLNDLCLTSSEFVTIKRKNNLGWYNYKCTPIEAITRKVNGGVNGFDDRKRAYLLLSQKIK